MNNNQKHLILLSFFFLCYATIFGQKSSLSADAQKKVREGKGVIACSVVNENNTPLDYATITVLKPSDSSMVSGGITDEKGTVILDNIDYGTYIVRIGYVGYKSLYINNITISKESPTAVVSRQKFSTSSKLLKGVTVSAEKEMIQSNLDKRVFNVDKSIVTEGSTGSDILENIPSVTVDLDGNVSLRGSSSVTILVDGRPTNLTMDEIPADLIETVEVVTNPSARYEPDGTSGIINVKLKKKEALGFNISASLGAGMSDNGKDVFFGKYNASLNLNFRFKKVNFFLGYNFRSFQSVNQSTLSRENIFSNDTTFLNQNSQNTFQGQPHSLRGGIDYYINDNNTLSFEVNYRARLHESENKIWSLTENSNKDTTSFYEQFSNNPPIPSHNISAAINYLWTSKEVKGRELSVDVYFSNDKRINNGFVDKQYYFPTIFNDYQKNLTNAISRRFNAQVDFVTPIGNGGRLETGYKFSYRLSDSKYQYFSGSDSNNLAEEVDRNETTSYTDIINAAYLIYSNTIGKKFQYQLGLRAELAKNISVLRSESEPFSPSPYFNLFPTVHLRYNFNDKHSVQLSYSMRVRRPNGRQLDPFLNDMDKLNLQQGNRKLKPEFTHSLEIGYLYSYKKTSVTANIFYRYRYDIISRYTILINDSTTYTTYENLDNSHSYGLEFSLQQGIMKFWNLSFNASLFQTFVNADSLYDESLRNDLSWQARLNNNFTLPLDFTIQLSANYRSPTITLNSMGFESGGAGQGRMSANWSIDLGIKKSFLKKTLSVSLRLNDIFNTRQTNVVSYGSTSNSSYQSEMQRTRDSRQLWLTVTYNFSNYKSKRKQEKERETDDSQYEMY